MIAYNILGYHLLSYPPPVDRPVESLPRNQLEIFPLCREHDVGVMIMKPLAGGLLCASKAFPPRTGWYSARGQRRRVTSFDRFSFIPRSPV